MTTTNARVDEAGRGKIKEIVCDILEIEPADMTDTSLFKDDHGADSMGAIEILSALESTFDVTIEQSELTRMVNLDNVVAVVNDAPAN
ncbi:acyl carrier protein [Saccharopolyspora sp. NFXS83]|uniref:acyl carrier protein n=1 Tax=Saccharopolyspora sp. NFXS83 TaxID=2993560 RepID=UPI00224A955A|nr:acyl carrier protein [Saccharopolyspora sp. NFXS83]MCX2732042.1 acyl carrier protein [Saccharopolyspora sp. NFXS83]